MLTQGQQLANQGSTGFQNQVYGSAANMGTPEQFAQGTGLLNQSGQGMLGTTGTAMTYGQQGAGYGQQATGAGQQYQNMATDPSQMQQWMNPYVQQALNPQLAILNQQQALAGQGIAAKATGQGAFGGNRAALAQGLNQQNYALAQQQAVGQGYSDAFKQAQQAQQFRADLGLRGLQAGMQGAQIGLQGVDTAQRGYAGATQAGVGLGNIGSQLGQYDLGKLDLQNKIANQQYNLPYQRLQFMQGLLQGLPVSTSSTQGFQAGPNKLSQMVGAGGALATAAPAIANLFKNIGGGSNSNNYIPNIDPNMDNRDVGIPETSLSTMPYNDLPYDTLGDGGAAGGLPKDFRPVKRYASGGIASINRRVMNDPTDYSENTVNRSAQNNVLGGVTKLLALDTIAKENQNLQNQQALQKQIPGSVLAQLQQQAIPQMPQQMAQGIDVAQSNLPRQYAGGGIIAFQAGGKSPRIDDEGNRMPYEPSQGIPDQISDLPAYLKAKLSPFFSGLREQINTGKVTPGATFNPAAQAVATPEVIPTATVPAKLDTSGIVVHENAPRAAGPAAGLAAPQIPTTPVYKSADTSGIDKLVKGYEDMIRGGDDFKQAEEKADTNAMRKMFLGMMAGKSPYFFTNAGEAGLAAQEGLEKTQEGIQARKDKQITQLMGLGLKGEDLKNAAKKMGIDEAELQAKLPTYIAEANYKNAAAQYYRDAKGKSTGAGLGGSLGEATVDKVMERFDAYRADYKNPSNPYVAMLTPQDQLYLQKGSGQSLANARKKLNELIDLEQQKRLNALSGYKQKRPVE
jgi:hypothetical protein